MSVSFDAREVLTHLNALGYRNISAEQLKEFIKDLKKLIKYESRIGAVLHAQQFELDGNRNEKDVFSKLHENQTTSIKAKYGTSAKKTETKPSSPSRKIKPRNIFKESNQIKNPPGDIKETKSRPQSASTTVTTNTERPKSAMDTGRRPKTPKSSRISRSARSSTDQKENRMWIRPKIPHPQPPRTKDPVQLYQFYQREWERFKPQLPGENDHSELRWQIRHKLMGGSS
ncbi:unnamed protein product [Hermetia illucens]|uniref:Centriolar and ciliogenesis-associated protein HYLS1 C-terminal domain-containing protein n=1 Tax=Hermetia illucens TaxID=343691 RepID=A0A7R8UER9_HERIL|nr:uncharacterized protein LOC119661497 [Hermetia illucens]CAD7079453.1 unnamed protein product [Hermetia illucens]